MIDDILMYGSHNFDYGGKKGSREVADWYIDHSKTQTTALKRLKYGRKNPNKVLFMIHLMFRHS